MTPIPSAAYIVEPLARRHGRKPFACGQPDLDRYLKQQARQDATRRVSATFVAVERGAIVVVGFYSLSATGVPMRDLPPETAARFPRYPLLQAARILRLDPMAPGVHKGEWPPRRGPGGGQGAAAGQRRGRRAHAVAGRPNPQRSPGSAKPLNRAPLPL